MSETIETLRLVTLTGNIIEIEYPNSILDELLDDFNDSKARQDYWNVGNWTEAKATFKGIRLEDIDMTKIIGTA